MARLPGESALAYEYFKLYCEMPAAGRSLQALCDRVVTGKKRSVAVFKRWSAQHDWQGRVAGYDTAVERAAAAELFARRRSEISDFIDNDLRTSLEFQRLCLARLKKLSSQGDEVDSKELRQLAMAYKESREWLKELIGLVELQNEMEAKDEKVT
ncbi:MAG: hypothetical protein OXU27_03210 [Candidatus Poribacteria bacterium]|nr:hypothetical protein [Candidatus Poribacteria bacterium]